MLFPFFFSSSNYSLFSDSFFLRFSIYSSFFHLIVSFSLISSLQMALFQYSLFLSLFLFLPSLLSVTAYPAFYMIRNLPQLQQPYIAAYSSPGDSFLSRPKRAFDRLDASPFDFDSISKRFKDDNELVSSIDQFYPSSISSPYVFEALRKRSFDRLENNAFFGHQKSKRTFGQLAEENSDR